MAIMKFRKRNKLDIILTDSRPVELPKNYTLVYFYNFLNSNKEMQRLFERIKRELKASDQERPSQLWGTEWHAIPLKYHVYKNKFELRELSLISPISMIELPLFVEAYEKQLLNFTSEAGFSVRKHKVNDKLQYLDVVEGSGIKYRYAAEKSIEYTGNYYSIYPYKYISDFQKSSTWYQLNRVYRYFGKIDYSKCFDSIYTHTYTWIVTKNSVDGKDYGKNLYFLNMCDRVLQNFNGSVTNGIVVGPEFSRLMVEILTQHIDECVKSRLYKENICENKDYSICRYVDDIFIFADEEKLVEHIIELYRSYAENFHFRLNEQKRVVGKLPYSWFDWKEKIHYVNDYICKTLFGDAKTSEYVIKYSPSMLPNMKMLYQDIIADYPDYQAKIASYVLTTIYKRIMNADRPLFSDESIVKKAHYLLDAIFYFYSFSLSYNNTEKVISILHALGKSIPKEIYRDCMHDTMCSYALSIAKANPEDVINIFLMAAMYTIELPDSVEALMTDKVSSSNNPLMYAVFLLYFGYNKTKSREYKKIVEGKILSAISNIYKDYAFFQYSEVWWLFVFANCPLISKSCRVAIKNKLVAQKVFLDRDTSNHVAKTAKKLVIEFLLDDKEKCKFINWDMEIDELFTYTDFTTYQRTLFNGYSEREDYDDDLNY